MISLIQLEYIVAVDTYRHFVTASEKCFVTQPTLSMQIKKLEEELGVTVFDRSMQPIIPTEIGKQIIKQARVILSESKKINEIIDDFNNSIHGELKIGIIPSLAHYLLPLFIGRFMKKYPDVQLKVIELLTEDIIKHLRKDLVDLGILVTPLKEDGIKEDPLFYEEMMLYINKNHTFASASEIDLQQIDSPDLWLLNNGHCFRSQIINLCNIKTQQPDNNHFQYSSDSLETIKKLIKTEGGYTMIPELAIDKQSTDKETVIRQFKNTSPLREVSLTYSRNYSKKRLLNLISEEIKAAVPKKMLDKSRGTIVEWR